MKQKHKTIIDRSILLTPLFIAFLWMGFLVTGTVNKEQNIQMSPSTLDGLINALFTFIVVYSLVLFFLFIKMNHDLKVVGTLEHKVKKSIKKRK